MVDEDLTDEADQHVANHADDRASDTPPSAALENALGAIPAEDAVGGGPAPGDQVPDTLPMFPDDAMNPPRNVPAEEPGAAEQPAAGALSRREKLRKRMDELRRGAPHLHSLACSSVLFCEMKVSFCWFP